MTIETKYNIGNEVWCRDFERRGYFGKPISVKVYCILVSIIDGCVKIDYRCCKENGDALLIEEKHLFPTKEELLKSL